MKLSSIYSRIVKGVHEADRLSRLSQEITEARETTRLNTVAIDSGDRALQNLTGTMQGMMVSATNIPPFLL